MFDLLSPKKFDSLFDLKTVEQIKAEAKAKAEKQEASALRCADCNCIIEGNPNLAGDLGHDDDYGPVPTVTICDDCMEDRRR